MPGLVLLALLLTASGTMVPADRGGVSDCLRSCSAHVDGRLRSTVCSACSGAPDDDHGHWVLELARVRPYPSEELEALGRDPDWEVGWGAVRVIARHSGVSETSALASRLRASRGPDELGAAVMVAHVLARRGQTSTALTGMGRDGPPAAARLWALRERVRAALELELFTGTAGERARSLGDLAVFLGKSPARVALDAIASRPSEADGEVAQALRLWCTLHHRPLTPALLEVARPADRPRVDRLLASYSQDLDRLRAELAVKDPPRQRAAALELRDYLPLSEPELRAALLGEDMTVAMAAADSLVGEGSQAILRHLESHVAAWAAGNGEPAEAVARWTSLAIRTSPEQCLGTLAPLARSQEAKVRAAVAPALSGCSGRPAVAFAALQADRDPEVRLAAVRAVAGGPSDSATLQRALTDADPRVVAESLRAIGQRPGMIQTVLPTLRACLRHSAIPVRVGAVELLSQHGGSVDTSVFAELLGHDPAAQVRVAAAAALAQLGGPVAVPALVEAANQDPDSHVQYVAKESLRRLGFQR